MTKIIAVDHRFEGLIKELEKRGYEVVDLYGPHRGVNACIYHDGIRDFYNGGLVQSTAVLMIDGKGRTVDDIESILQRGAYSSLF